MNKTLLCAAILGTLALVQAVQAQEFDDRWYGTASINYLRYDNDRNVGDGFSGYGIGFGRLVSPNLSLDLEFNQTTPEQKISRLNFDQAGVSLDARYFFRMDGRAWAPYALFGAGVQHHEEEFILLGRSTEITGSNLAVQAGLGLQADAGKWGFRAESRYRIDANDESAVAPRSGSFGDWIVSLGVLYRIGTASSAPVAAQEPAAVEPPAPVVTCADLDDDGDGVNNCEDKCPASQAGQAIGPDGCPVALTIDLRGVNFEFDKATLRPESTAILDEAATVLSQYPQLKVEVAGHTDAVGADAYNQGLSERRAKAAYDYLLAHGVSAGQLTGPNGYGEARPIDSNDTSEGRARNRRTELNVQN